MQKKKRILITGSTHGIGKKTAEEFLGHGWEVYGCGSSREDVRGPQMAEKYTDFHFMCADVSDENEVEGLLRWCGNIDAAFNNAGIGWAPSPAHHMDIKAAGRILEVNLLGTALCMKHECRAMLKGSGGVILNNSSVAAYKAGTGADGMYSASKAGILRLTAEAGACEEYRGKIKFFSVIPGWIETRMTAMDDKEIWKKRLPSGKVGTVKEVAELVYRVVENQRCFDSGQEFHINGGGILV